MHIVSACIASVMRLILVLKIDPEDQTCRFALGALFMSIRHSRDADVGLPQGQLHQPSFGDVSRLALVWSAHVSLR